MSTRVTDTAMTSDETRHTARKVNHNKWQVWSVSWLPHRLLDRNQATTAMVLAEWVATYWDGFKTVGIDRRRFHGFTQQWAGELGLSEREVMQQLASTTGAARS